jgi:hypothetical protein
LGEYVVGSFNAGRGLTCCFAFFDVPMDGGGPEKISFHANPPVDRCLSHSQYPGEPVPTHLCHSFQKKEIFFASW